MSLKLDLVIDITFDDAAVFSGAPLVADVAVVVVAFDVRLAFAILFDGVIDDVDAEVVNWGDSNL